MLSVVAIAICCGSEGGRVVDTSCMKFVFFC